MNGNVLLAVIVICSVAGYFAMSFLIDALRKPRDEVSWARAVLGFEGQINAEMLRNRYHELLAESESDLPRTRDVVRAWEILSKRINS